MRTLVLHVLLTATWVALTGQLTWINAFVGMVLSMLLLEMLRVNGQKQRYWKRVVLTVRFVAFVVWELLIANFRMAVHVYRPLSRLSPGIVSIPLDVRTDAEITMLANLITLTPGTLSLDVAADRRTLYVHCITVSDPDAVRREIKNGFERRVLELFG